MGYDGPARVRWQRHGQLSSAAAMVRATGVAATEDVMPMLEGMGIESRCASGQAYRVCLDVRGNHSVGICGDTSPGRGPRPPSVKALCR